MQIPGSLIILAVSQWILLASLVHAYYPGHPEVQAMVDKGINYLEGLSDEEIVMGNTGGREYHSILLAYAHLKAEHEASAPLVQKGIKRARQLSAEVAADSGSWNSTSSEHPHGNHTNKSNYAISVAIILLCEADASKFRSEIEKLRNILLSRQQPGGGFGYHYDDHGDTSQSQYVVLAFWAMNQSGISVDPEVVNRVHKWFMRVQDLDGAWPYRAEDPGPGAALIKQPYSMMTHSTALAGGSSVLIAADYFDLWRGGSGGGSAAESGVLPGMPLAVRLPDQEKSQRSRITVNPGASEVPKAKIIAAVERMNDYRRKVPYQQSGSTWHYYAMYSQERFESFYEYVTSEGAVASNWYDEGVEKLKRNQHSSGAWGVSDYTSSPPPVATAFAILFLVRSTQQAIAASSGSLGGGQGLPKDTTDIKVEGTSIKGRPVAADIGNMLDLLEDDAGDLEGKSIPDDLQLAEDPRERRAQIDRLERLVRGSQSWQARRVAARLLGKSEQMRVVPALIFALSDPDLAVRRYARDGLRFISRKFDGFGLPDQPTEGEVREAQQQWRQWYLTINPKYVFLPE